MSARSFLRLIAAMAASLAMLVAVVPAALAESTTIPISGMVGTAAGDPASGAQVCLLVLSDQSTICTYATESGSYEFSVSSDLGAVQLYATLDGLPQTYYSADGSTTDPESATVLTVEVGAALTGLDFSFAAPTGIKGTVALSDSGSAEVQIRACSGWNDEDTWDCSTTSVTSSDSGAFSIYGLAPGTYRVTYSAPGYGASVTDVTVIQSKMTVLDLVTLSQLAPGSLSGTVLKTNGDPLPGVAVTAHTTGRDPLTTTSNASGQYSFADVPAGVWWDVEFAKDGYAAASDGVRVNPGQNVVMATTHLAAAASVNIELQNTTGAAIPAAELRLCSGDDGDENCVWATEIGDGYYTFTGLTPGAYVLHASAEGYLEAFYPGVRRIADATPVRVTEGGTLTLSEPFTMTRPASLSGAVTYSDGSAAGAEVGLYDSTGAEVDSHSVYSSGSGAYEFTNVWPGSYTVAASSWDGFGTTWLGGSATYAGATRVTLAQTNAATGKNIVVTGDVVVTGTVTDGGDPVEGAIVELYSSNDEYVSRRANTASDGTYSMRIPAGTYDTSIDLGGVRVCGSTASTLCGSKTVTVSAANKVVNFALPASLASLSGAISVSGNPVAFAVELLDASKTNIARMSWEDSEGGPMPTDYAFFNVPYGNYTIEVSADFSGQDYTTYQSAAITVDAPLAAHDVTIAAAPHTITGTITTAQAEDSVEITAINLETGLKQGTTLEDVAAGSSSYSLGVGPGIYKLFASTSDADLWYSAASTMADAQPVTVATGSNPSGIDFTFPQTRFAVTGKLVLPEGVSTELAQRLHVWFADPEVTSENSDADTYTATLDDSGNYSVNLPAGTYRPHVEASPALGTIATSGTTFSVTTNQAGPDISVAKGGALEGRVLASDGVPVAGAEVTVTGANGLSDEAYADGLGYWHMEGIEAGTATVKAIGTGYVSATASASPTVVAGQTRTVATITLQRAGRLYVDIPESGFGGVSVVVTDTSGKTLRVRSVYSGDGPTVIDNVPVGTVKVRFEDEEIVTEWWKDATSLAAATPVTLNATTSVTLVPTLAEPTSGSVPTGTLSGTVTNTSGVSGHLSVVATSETTSRHYQADADADGAYHVVAPVGTYSVTASLCTGLWVPVGSPQGNSDIGYCEGGRRSIDRQDPVQVTATGSTTGVDFSFGLADFTGTPTPTITGATSGGAKVGDVLTAHAGGWSPSPDRFTYQWLRDGSDISGATAVTYTLTNADQAADISVKVTAIRSGYQSVAKTSAVVRGPAGAAFATAPIPTITGDAKLDATLTAHAGTWDPVADKLVYTWFAGSTQIAQGEDLTTYALTKAEVGKTITVKVTASKAGYEPTTTESLATDAVTALTMTPAKPQISGQAKVGVELTANVTGWDPADADLSYTWAANGVVIAGASQSTFTPTSEQVGKTITVTVTGSKTGYLAASETSDATTAVVTDKISGPTPRISGTAKVGYRLAATAGTWAPTGVALSYQWYASGVAISGASGSSVLLTAAQLGKTITVTVTGSASGYTAVSLTSARTAAVAAGTLSAKTPLISGTAKVGKKLTAKPGTWGPAPVTLRYQWYANGKKISKATASSYKIAKKYKGKKITVIVTGIKAGYTTVAKKSSSTKSVK